MTTAVKYYVKPTFRPQPVALPRPNLHKIIAPREKKYFIVFSNTCSEANRAFHKLLK